MNVYDTFRVIGFRIMNSIGGGLYSVSALLLEELCASVQFLSVFCR